MNSCRASHALRLFAMPSFFRGAARVLDLGCTLNVYNESKSEAEADFSAIASDWAQVGSDIFSAMEQHKHGE